MESPLSESPRLSFRVLFAYGLTALPAQFAYVLVLIMYLKYATVEFGASPAAIGSIFLLAKIWDAISDPMVGNLSDRTQTRFGRRRPWLYASGPMLAIFFMMAWIPPSGLSGAGLIAWITVAIFGFYTAYTVFEVPHKGLAVELSFDRQERNRIFGARQLLTTSGMFLAGTLGVALVERGTQAAAWMAIGLGVAAIVLVWGSVAQLPPERSDFAGRGGENPFKAMRDVFSNRHARLLLFVFFIESIGSGGIGVLTPFLITFVMKMDIAPQMLGLYMVSAVAAVPFWVWMANFFEKRHLWLYAMLQGGVGYGLLFWLGEGDWILMAASSFLAGSAGACGNTLGQALKAEVIDYDELHTGERKEGAYFAAWSFMSKLAAGLMIGVVGFALEWSGFDKDVAEQTHTVKQTMIWLCGGVPLIGYGIGSLAFTRFKLTEAEHARIRAELDQRNATA